MRNSKISSITVLAIIAAMLMASMMHSNRSQARTLATTAVPQSGCDLLVTSISGATGAFNVTGSGTANLSIASLGMGMQSVVVGTANNTNVTISSFSVGTNNPVTVTAAVINPNQANSFTVTAADVVGHTITISAIVHCPEPPLGCTFTQGYWKNHASAWPVQSLTLGTVTYTKAQLISILNTPVKGNGLISLSYQLIAAKLNAAGGASVPPDVASAIAAADALIGGLVVPPVGSGSLSPDSTSSLNTTLDTYNNGLAAGGPSHCE
jgi:hypothetical protein